MGSLFRHVETEQNSLQRMFRGGSGRRRQLEDWPREYVDLDQKHPWKCAVSANRQLKYRANDVFSRHLLGIGVYAHNLLHLMTDQLR